VGRNRSFLIFLTASVVIACLSDLAPRHTMPYDYSAVVSRSIPLAVLWAIVVVASVFLLREGALWLLVGAPIALYWPVWLLVGGYPSCWYMGNCG
jgi:hypothetical protein